jgi:hypothetical protein
MKKTISLFTGHHDFGLKRSSATKNINATGKSLHPENKSASVPKWYVPARSGAISEKHIT